MILFPLEMMFHQMKGLMVIRILGLCYFIMHGSIIWEWVNILIFMGLALIIGLAQAFAILPGVSRSGSTLAMALLLGMSRTQGAKFSFMIGLPAIFGELIA